MGLQLPFISSLNKNLSITPAAYSAAIAKYVYMAPQGVGQIDAFAFDYQTTNQVRLENEITDHYLEDNSAVQDHIAIKPNIVILRGYVAELVLKVNVISAVLGTVENGLLVELRSIYDLEKTKEAHQL